MYYLYHIPEKKIGITRDLKERVERQQGYEPSEYGVLMSTEDIDLVSRMEINLQKGYGYRVDEVPYNKLKCNNKMDINITEMTTTFPCPVNKLKGRLMDNIDFSWETDHGEFSITKYTIDWIMDNVKTSQYTQNRCYVYNKAFARFYDNHQTHDHPSHDKLGGNLEDARVLDNARQSFTRTGALSPVGVRQEKKSHFDLIRQWAEERGLYKHGDTKTQALKLVEEMGEICRAILKENYEEVTDGIGDCVVVLTNLAELHGVSIEDCIEEAYHEIKNRKGKMDNGTFKKDDN